MGDGAPRAERQRRRSRDRHGGQHRGLARGRSRDVEDRRRSSSPARRRRRRRSSNALVSSTDAVIVVAERSLEQTIERMGFSTEVHLFDEGTKRSSKDVPVDVPSHDSASRDLAFIVSTSGVGGTRKDVAHTHGSVFATRVQAEHWLDVGRGDAVWCTSESTSPLTIWNTVVGPWSRGAEVVTPARRVRRRRAARPACSGSDRASSASLRPSTARSPSTPSSSASAPRASGASSRPATILDPEVVAVFEERWGMSIADGYGQAETNIVVANLADGAVKPAPSGALCPAITSRSSTTRATSCRTASKATLPSAAGPPRCSPATGSFPRRRSRPSSATGT